MSQQLISHSPDLKRLRDEGYELEVRGGYLIIHHIPYVNKQAKIKYGKLISNLTLSGDKTVRPDNHVIHFMGEYPCNKEGSEITALQHANPNQQIFDDLVLNYSFSNKPPNGYADYYQKVTTYGNIISSQANAIDPKVTAKNFNVIAETNEESPFRYIDSNSSRANISPLNVKFMGQKIGIVGLGGTGSYILDLIAKTHVDEILLFDGDFFLQHNAFRSPSAPSIEKMSEKLMKVDYFSAIYSNMHKGIKPYGNHITVNNIHILDELSYVFICIDNNDAKGFIIKHLMRLGIPFIDVGLGLNIAEDNLVGTVRVTTGTELKNDHIPIRIGLEDIDNNEYSTNIQIAELNALNAALAVIKWKKLCGFYQDVNGEHHTTYTINTAQIINNDLTL